MSRPITSQRPSPPVILPCSRVGTYARALFSSSPGSGVSPWSAGANDLLAFPFVLEATTTIYKGFACTGSAAGSNFEVGILDADYNKIVSSGSVSGGAVASVPVMADFTDVTLPPGLYYAGMSCDATTTNRWTRWSASITGLFQSAGFWKQASAGPGSFPTTATPADLTNVAFPLFGLITRSVFDV